MCSKVINLRTNCAKPVQYQNGQLSILRKCAINNLAEKNLCKKLSNKTSCSFSSKKYTLKKYAINDSLYIWKSHTKDIE